MGAQWRRFSEKVSTEIYLSLRVLIGDRGLAGRSELIGPPNRFDTEFPIAYALSSPRSVRTVTNEDFVRHEGALSSLEARRGPGSETDSDLVS